jgi:hypothetical protein
VAARYPKDLDFGDGLARLLCLFWVGIACSPSLYVTVSWRLGLYACGRWCFCASKSLDCHLFLFLIQRMLLFGPVQAFYFSDRLIQSEIVG